MNSFKLRRNILFYYIRKGRGKKSFCFLVSLALLFRFDDTLQSGISNNTENQKNENQNMENLKISFLAYWLFSEFLILEDYILTI